MPNEAEAERSSSNLERGGGGGVRGCAAWVVALSVVGLASGAPAQEVLDEDDLDGGAPEHETVVVAERLPEDELTSARSVSVVGAAALSERAPRTVPEALWDAPGVFVQQTNLGGGSPILRGMVGPQNLLLVEGVRLNNSVWRTGPVQYLNLIDPLLIAGLEVLRGPGSVLYGSDAMGGVVHVRLLPPGVAARSPRGWGVRLVGRTAVADAERTAHAAVSGAGADVAVLGAGTFSAFDDLTGGRDTGRQEHTGYSRWSSLGRLGWRAVDRPGLHLSINAAYLVGSIDRAGRTDQLAERGSLQIYDNTDHLAFVRTRLAAPRLRTAGELTLSFQSFFERKDSLTLDDLRVLTLSTVRDEVTVRTLGVDLHLVSTLLAGRLRLQYGGTWYRDWIGSDQARWSAGGPARTSESTSFPDGSSYDVGGAFVLVDGEPLRLASGHAVRLTAGYRLHGMGGRSPATEWLEAVDTTAVGHTFFGAVQYRLARRLNVAATYSQGFRVPNLNEAIMVGDTGKYFHVPNYDLEPERSDTFELRVAARVCRLTLGATGYVSLVRDLIRREETTWGGEDEIDGKPVAWNVNAGDGLILGMEWNVALEIGWGLSVLGSLTYTWGEGRTGASEGVPMTRIPPLFGQATLRYEGRIGPRWTVFVEGYVRAAGEQDRLSPEDEADARIPDGGTPGWWTLNARAGVALPERFAMRVGVENLLNATYRYHGSGVDGAGTTANLALELHF